MSRIVSIALALAVASTAAAQDSDGSFRSGDFGFAGGFVWRPLWRLNGGSEGRALEVGGVGAWQIAPEQRE